jgi:tetratricopeptide (TPR) repeat protein
VFGARDWLLIASVDNRSGDSLLGDDLGGALAVALEQSRFANVVTRPMVASALQMMGRPDTTRLTRDVAREVAQRLNARAVVHPSVDPAATGVDLTLHVVAAESGSDLVRESATAPSRGEVLATLGRLAEQLRRRLGERLRDEPPQTALEFATSPSLDALRLWSEGQRLFRLAKYDAAIASYKDALALDSNFARAHNSIAVSYYWLNNRERGDFHFDRAQALTGRLTERERLTLIADAANWRGRSAEAINGYERLLQRYPDDRRVRGQLAYALLRADRDAEAADNYEALLRVDSTNFASRINLATALVGLGKLSEALPHYARAFALGNRSLADNVGLAHEYAMAMSNAGFPDSARLLLTPLAKGTVIERASLARTLGLIHVTQGSADSALRLFREAEALSMRAGNPTTFVRNQLYVARTLLLLGRAADAIRQLSQVEAELKVKRVDPPWIADAATVAASAGDLPRARRFLAASEARADLGNVEDQGSVNRARAAVALAAKKINDAVSAAESSRAARADMRTTELLGRVYEAAGRLADARDRHAEVVEQPWGAAENVFARAGSLADAARLSFVLGDSAAGRRYAEMLLTAWPREDGGIPLRARVAALIRPQP